MIQKAVKRKGEEDGKRAVVFRSKWGTEIAVFLKKTYKNFPSKTPPKYKQILISFFCLPKIFAKRRVVAFWLDRWVGGIYRSIQWISVLPSSPFSTPHSFPFLFSFFSYLRGNDCFGRLERNMGIRCMREGVAEQHFCSSLHDDDFQGLEEEQGGRRKQGEAPSGQSTEFATYFETKKNN